jgi:mitogen-activated protein kinase kinase 1
MKIIPMSNPQVQQDRAVKQEESFIRVMETKDFPNVVQAIDVYYVDCTLKILMEYMDVGTLKDIISVYGPIPSKVASCIMKQVLHGLQGLHTTKLLHRDLKPSNLLANSHGCVKISDFGVSRFFRSNKQEADTMVGSKPYMSPERILGKTYGTSSDVWSVGLTLAELALGRYPFYPGEIITDIDACEENPWKKRSTMFDLASTIAERSTDIDLRHQEKLVRKFYPDARLDLTPSLVDFVGKCLKYDPTQRSTCSELLEHPFIKENEDFDEKQLAKWLVENVKDKIKEARAINRHHSHHHK